MESLYTRLGGDAAVNAVTKVFYQNIQADAAVSHFFKGINMENQTNKTATFLCACFGGPAWTGRVS